MDPSGLTELLAHAHAGDTLALVRFDRLGRPLGELLTVVKQLEERSVALLHLGNEPAAYPIRHHAGKHERSYACPDRE